MWVQNGLPWTTAFRTRNPYLVDPYEHDDNESGVLPDYAVAVANGGMDDRVRAFPAKIGEVLEIVIQNTGAAANGGLDVHPFHMHGAHIYDIGARNGTYDVDENERRLQGTQPVKRNTTMLYRYDDSRREHWVAGLEIACDRARGVDDTLSHITGKQLGRFEATCSDSCHD
jgi:L-ascorbate oxidase